jgi:hypothetical protein
MNLKDNLEIEWRKYAGREENALPGLWSIQSWSPDTLLALSG